MGQVPGASSMPTGAMTAPQAVSPSKPDGAVDILYDGFQQIGCWIGLTTTRRWPLNPGFVPGCLFQDPGYGGPHLGIDLFNPSGYEYAFCKCPAVGGGVEGGNIYPAFGGCIHQGTPYKAKVILAEDLGGSGVSEIGKTIILEHLDETHRIQIRTVYMHLATMAVSAGDFVSTSDVIGTVGISNDFPHLHFEVLLRISDHPKWRTAAERALMPPTIRANRPAVDPAKLLPRVCEDDEIDIAGLWIPFGQFPCDGGYAPEKHVITKMCGVGANETYIEKADDPLEIYPLMDAPDGRIYVVWAHDDYWIEGGVFCPGGVLLLHNVSVYQGYALYSLYWNTSYGGDDWPDTVVHVNTGEFVDLTTKIATFSVGGEGGTSVLCLMVFALPIAADPYNPFAGVPFVDWDLADEYTVCPGLYYWQV